MVSNPTFVVWSRKKTLFLGLLFCFVSRVLLGQDPVLMNEAMWANSDCHRNYDASLEFTVFAEIPSDPQEIKNLEVKFREFGMVLWDEKHFLCRIVVTNEPPIQVLFVAEWTYLRDGKSAQRIVHLAHWRNEIARLARGNAPPGHSIETFDMTRDRFHDTMGVPVLEECRGLLFGGSSVTSEYFDNRALYREIDREWLSSPEFIISSLPNGTIRLSRKRSELVQSQMDYDPITSHQFTSATLPLDVETNDLNEATSWRRWSYQMHNEILRIASSTMKKVEMGVAVHGSASVHWHQFNEDSLRFPERIVDKLSLEDGLQFLADGQSEMESKK
jgi:hypothetical protein